MKANSISTTLGAIAKIGAGNSAPQDKTLFTNGTYPFFRTSDVGQIRFGMISQSRDYLNAVGITGLRLYPQGTILLPKSGASTFLNHRVILAVDGYVSSHLATIIVDKKKVSENYLLYFLSTISAQDLIQDHSYPSLNLPMISAIPIDIPPLSEQQRIVRKLDEAYAAIAKSKENAEKNLANARAIFESELNALFERKGNGWVEMPLASLCDIKHGFAFDGQYFRTEGEYVLLTPGNFFETGGYRDRGDKQKYYGGPIPNGFILDEGDMLVAMTEQAAGLLGSPIIVPESDKFLHNQRLGLVTPKNHVPWVNDFFFYVFNTKKVRKEIHTSASGVKVRHTSPRKLGEVVVGFPQSTIEQEKLVIKLNSLHSETERLASIYQCKMKETLALQATLLHHAFTGQL